jgi:hypothetical protein
VMYYLFVLEWDWYGLDKKCVRIRYTQLLFLHSVGSVGQVLHSSASGK